jgi:hypothetical protein
VIGRARPVVSEAQGASVPSALLVDDYAGPIWRVAMNVIPASELQGFARWTPPASTGLTLEPVGFGANMHRMADLAWGVHGHRPALAAASDKFSEASTQRMAARLQTILSGVLASPDARFTDFWTW